MKDELGTRMKSYEFIEKDKFMSYLPVYARIDGRNFSKYTKKFNRPFDSRLNKNMTQTSEALLKEFKADLAYTQSDEISLFWKNTDKISSQFVFGGVKQKIVSVIAGYTSSYFYKNSLELDFPENQRLPHFDCRVIQMPNITELYNMLLWRQKDCFRNAVTSKSIEVFSHKKIHGVSTKDKIKNLCEKEGKELKDIIDSNYLYGTFSYKENKEIDKGVIRTFIISKSPSFMVNDLFSELDEFNYETSIDCLIDKLKLIE